MTEIEELRERIAKLEAAVDEMTRNAGVDFADRKSSKKLQLAATATPNTGTPMAMMASSPGADLVHIGGDASPIAVEESFSHAMLSVSAGSLASGGDAAILFTSRSPIVSSIMYLSGGDRGWRFWYNMKPIGPNQRDTSDPTLGQIAHQYEQDGSVSWTYFKPQNVAAGAYDNLPGKSLTIYPGGFNSAETAEYVDVGVGQAGRGLRLGATISGSNNPTPMVQMDGDGNPNPVAIYAEGVLQTVVVKVVDGVKVFAPA